MVRMRNNKIVLKWRVTYPFSTHVSEDSSTTLSSPQLINLGWPCTHVMSLCGSPGRAYLGYGSNLADTECGSTLSGQLNPIMSVGEKNQNDIVRHTVIESFYSAIFLYSDKSINIVISVGAYNRRRIYDHGYLWRRMGWREG